MAELPTVDEVEVEALVARLAWAAPILEAEGVAAEQVHDAYRLALDPSLLVGWVEVLDGLDPRDRMDQVIPLGEVDGRRSVASWTGSGGSGRVVRELERSGRTATTRSGRFVFVRSHGEAAGGELGWTLTEVRGDDADGGRSTALTVVWW